MVIHRHRCGLMFSQAFADYLASRQAEEEAEHVGEILAIDYVRCADGPEAGSEWYQISWIAAVHAARADRLDLGGVTVHVHKQARRALAKRCLDFRDGEIRILS